MGGDENVAEWLGDVWANRVQTSATPTRFNATPLRFKSVDISNNDPTDHAYIGKYYSSDATFIANATIIRAYNTKHFEYLDLYEFGYRTQSGTVYLQIICINEY
jgi:hypothetical protein